MSFCTINKAVVQYQRLGSVPQWKNPQQMTTFNSHSKHKVISFFNGKFIDLAQWQHSSPGNIGYNRWQFPGIVTNSSGVFGQVICLIKLKKSSVLSLVKLRGFLQEPCNGFAQYYFLYHCQKVLEGTAKNGWVNANAGTACIAHLLSYLRSESYGTVCPRASIFHSS